MYRNFVGALQGRNIQPIGIKFGTKFSLDVNKNWLVYGDFRPKRVEMVGGWNIKKFITTLIWMIPVWLQMDNILLINLYNICLKSFLIGVEPLRNLPLPTACRTDFFYGLCPGDPQKITSIEIPGSFTGPGQSSPKRCRSFSLFLVKYFILGLSSWINTF